MTQQPFSRPGAVDLSGLQTPVGPPGAGVGTGFPAPYAVIVDDASFQEVLEASRTAPVLLAFESPSRSPESVTLARDLEALSAEFEGRFLVGRVDIDVVPQIAQTLVQAMQIQSMPLVVLVAQGRPMPLFQEPLPIEDLREAMTQVLQQLTTQGFSGRHQPRSGGVVDEETGEEQIDPRYLPAQDALERGDIDAAVVEYEKLAQANPADAEAAAGLAMARVLQRTDGVDLQAARAAAAEQPDDVDAQTLVADLDLLGGHVEDAFARLIALVRRTAEGDRDRARTHLVGLFGAVGNDDPRVQVARRNLASALF